jgi:hypothetical protein
VAGEAAVNLAAWLFIIYAAVIIAITATVFLLRSRYPSEDPRQPYQVRLSIGLVLCLAVIIIVPITADPHSRQRGLTLVLNLMLGGAVGLPIGDLIRWASHRRRSRREPTATASVGPMSTDQL